MTGKKPNIMISACLTGERVRYDGEHKRNHLILDFLGDSVNWIPICPEVHAGFGTPRPPIELVMVGDSLEVLEVETRRPVTSELNTACRYLLLEAHQKSIHGVILKSRSPSCGLNSTPILISEQDTKLGSGLFAHSIQNSTSLPVIDEIDFAVKAKRWSFLESITANPSFTVSDSHILAAWYKRELEIEPFKR